MRSRGDLRRCVRMIFFNRMIVTIINNNNNNIRMVVTTIVQRWTARTLGRGACGRSKWRRSCPQCPGRECRQPGWYLNLHLNILQFPLSRLGWQSRHPSSPRRWMPDSFGRSPSSLRQLAAPLACTDQRSFFIGTSCWLLTFTPTIALWVKQWK